ncbi:MAG: oligosaccharide flippase family protein [Microcoleaceae cyanobacterium]
MSRLKPLAQGAIIAFLAQVFGVALTYGSNVFLARWLGIVEFGIYEYVIALAVLLSVLVGLGLPTAVLRFIAQYQVTQQWGELQGLIRSSWLITLGAGLGLIATIIASTNIFINVFQFQNWIYFTSFLIGIWLVPLLTLAQLQTEMARAIQKIGLAYIPFQIVLPILVFWGVVICRKLGFNLDSQLVLSLSVVSLIVVLCVQGRLIWQQFHTKFPVVEPIYLPLEWLRVALPLLFQGVFLIILNQTDILMIGAWITPKAVGIYSVAAKTSIWAGFILQAINTVVAPRFTTLYIQKDEQGLRSLVKVAAHWIFWPSGILILGLLIFATPILQLFGSEFSTAQEPMIALLVGQLFNVGCGSVGYLMIMTGHQNEAVMIFGWSALINIILNAILIPQLGILGAAIATALTMAIWNVWLHVLVVRYLKVYPSIVYALFQA